MTAKSVTTSTHTWVLCIISLFFGLYYLWGASYYATVIPRQEFPTGWDNGTVLLWQYLFQTGFLPYRDFWYPYGGLILVAVPFPWGFIFNATYCALVLILSFLSFYLITNRSLWRSLGIFVIWFGLAHQNMFPVIRYAILVPFLVSYVCAASEKKRIGLSHVVFWSSAVLSILGDVVTAVYGGLLIGLVLSLDAFENWSAFRLDIANRFKREFAVPSLFFGVYLLVLALNGQIPGFVEFYRTLGGVAQYAGSVAPIDDYFQWKPFNNGFFIWGAVILVAWGIFFYLTDSPKNRKVSLGILLLGIANIMLIYKQLVHPNTAYFFGVSTTIAGVLMIVLASPERIKTGQYIAAFFFSGILFGAFQTNDGMATLWNRFSRPVDLINDFKSLISPPIAYADYASVQWDLKNFRQYSTLIQVLDGIVPRMSANKPSDLFVLTEEPALYIMAKKRPPFYQSLYDGSLLSAQTSTVQWLERNRPSVVVFNTKGSDVFGVPGTVRAPIVYEQVILNYVLDVMIGDFAVLRRRLPGESVDVKFWRQYLSSIELRELPRLTSMSKFAECRETPQCVDFLEIHLKAPVASSTPASVPIIVGENNFEIHFVMIPDQQRYVIYLDRLWFWGALKRGGFSPVVGPADSRLEWSVIHRAKREDILY